MPGQGRRVQCHQTRYALADEMEALDVWRLQSFDDLRRSQELIEVDEPLAEQGAMKVKCKESLFEVVAEIVGFGICRCGRSRSEPAQLDGEHFSAAADKIVNGSGRSSTVVDAVLRQVKNQFAFSDTSVVPNTSQRDCRLRFNGEAMNGVVLFRLNRLELR